jgi:DNA-binding NarL/FixJ family response regulator
MSHRVLLVEDEPGIREALSTALAASGFQVIGAFGRGEEAARAAVDLGPEVALVDLGLPGISGVETIRRLRRALPELPVLVLTVFESPEVIVEAIEAGAAGYLLKGTPLPEVLDGIRQVKDGLAPISPAVARHLLDRVRARGRSRAVADAPEVNLTQRESEVLSFLVGGHSYASIATALGIRPGTVHTHVKNVYRKLEVASKAEAVAVAIRQGLVPDEA